MAAGVSDGHAFFGFEENSLERTHRSGIASHCVLHLRCSKKFLHPTAVECHRTNSFNGSNLALFPTHNFKDYNNIQLCSFEDIHSSHDRWDFDKKGPFHRDGFENNFKFEFVAMFHAPYSRMNVPGYLLWIGNLSSFHLS